MAISVKKVRSGLLRLAADLEEAGYTKLASRTTKCADELVNPPAEPEEATAEESEEACEDCAAEGSEESQEEAQAEGSEEGVLSEDVTEEVEAAADEDGEEEAAAEGEDEGGESVEALGDEEEADEVAEAEDAEPETVEAAVSLREACTRLYRIATKAKSSANENVRHLGDRLMKIERYIRSSL